MEFRNSYSRNVGNAIIFAQPSRTQQHFRDECDINNIIARYENTGSFYDPMTVSSARQPMFDDFSALPDYMEAQNFIAEAGEKFNELPARVRRRFDNSPAKLLEFLSDSDNDSEAIALGLKSAPVVDPTDVESSTKPSPGNTQAE